MCCITFQSRAVSHSLDLFWFVLALHPALGYFWLYVQETLWCLELNPGFKHVPSPGIISPAFLPVLKVPIIWSTVLIPFSPVFPFILSLQFCCQDSGVIWRLHLHPPEQFLVSFLCNPHPHPGSEGHRLLLGYEREVVVEHFSTHCASMRILSLDHVPSFMGCWERNV